MKDLYIVAEGETEEEFVNRLLIPYLNKQGVHTNIQVIMIKKSGGGHGYSNIAHFENTIKPVLNYKNEPIITTFLDYYGLDSEQKIPDYAKCIKFALVDDKIRCMEKSLNETVQRLKPYRFFIPYIQKHEFETLLFADPTQFLENEVIAKAVQAICETYENIEDINNSPQTAPSKRLIQIYEQANCKYQKVVDAVDIAELTGIDKILEKCPKFAAWVAHLIDLLKNI
jgi:hypothetical protein